MAIERVVGAMRCSEVLAELSDYLDGEMPQGRRDQVTEHLKGCDVCEQFGSVLIAAIDALRKEGRCRIDEESVIYERLRVRLGQAARRDLS